MVDADTCDESIGIRPSKSDTSLTDSFVVVTADGETKEEDPVLPPVSLRRTRNNQHTLRQGNYV